VAIKKLKINYKTKK